MSSLVKNIPGGPSGCDTAIVRCGGFTS